MKINYSAKINLGEGWGLLVEKQIEALKEHNYLGQLLLPNSFDRADFSSDESFDNICALHMKKGDIFFGQANQSLEQLQKAKDMGMTTIIHRGNAHVSYQEQILRTVGINMDFSSVNRQIKEYGLADYIMVDSEYILHTFDKINPGLTNKIRITPLGVDTKKFIPGEKSDKFIILFVGQNIYRKGLKYLLEAWKKFINKDDMELHIVGANGKDTGNVKFMGYVDEKTLINEYQKASMFCLPSLDDGFGMVCLEALSCGTPIIISENTGAKDILHRGFGDSNEGEIVPVANYEVLRDKIKYYHKNREKLVKMGRVARKTALLYDWDNYKQNFIDFFERRDIRV